MAMIEIRGVSKWYGKFQVLTECSSKVEKGEVVVVCGPSGSGKSTLIKCVNGLEPFDTGEILVNGTPVGDPKTDLPKLRSHVGMVFQHFELFPHMTVIENLTVGQVKVLGRNKDEALRRGAALLDRVGLKDFAGKNYNRPMEMYVFAAVIYFAICLTLSMLVKRLQKKIAIVR